MFPGRYNSEIAALKNGYPQVMECSGKVSPQ
jgi:hypothetical protein